MSNLKVIIEAPDGKRASRVLNVAWNREVIDDMQALCGIDVDKEIRACCSAAVLQELTQSTVSDMLAEL